MQRKISFGVYSIHSIAQNKKFRKIYWSGLCTDILYLWKTIEFLVIFLLLDFIPNSSSNVSIISRQVALISDFGNVRLLVPSVC